MFIKLVIEPGKCISSVDELSFTSPQCFVSSDKQECLLFNRLPTGLCKEDLLAAISGENFEFIWSAEKDFVAFHIKLESNKPIVRTVVDRYGSWRVYHKLDSDSYVASTYWQDVVPSNFAFSREGLADLISSRLLYDDHAVFEDVRVNPLQHFSYYNGSLTFSEIFCASPKFPEFQNDSATIDFIEASLKRSLNKVKSEHESCAVLLSGGTDSFILAALAKQVFGKVVAYTPTWQDDFNPELERAQIFAKHLGIEHRIVTLHVDEIGDAYSQLINVMGIPIRNFSSVPLFALLKQIDEEAVLYGEFADTLFGSRPFKNKLLDRKYLKLLRPFRVVPKIQREINSLSVSENLYSIIWLNGVSEKDFEHAGEIYLHDAEKLSGPFLKSDDTVGTWKDMNLRTDCRQHIVELELAAAFYEKVVVTPFYNLELIQLSDNLTDEQLFGPKGLSVVKNFKQDYSLDIKNLLKELACRYIDRQHIYRNKLGFPTPHVKWILTLFKEDLNELKARGIIDSTDPSYIKSRYEWVWTQLNLYHISSAVTQPTIEESTALA